MHKHHIYTSLEGSKNSEVLFRLFYSSQQKGLRSGVSVELLNLDEACYTRCMWLIGSPYTPYHDHNDLNKEEAAVMVTPRCKHFFRKKRRQEDEDKGI
ncbi:hypothetical protein KY290_008823 [Solanum tuberosum]|uniref:Uncharacterized protein n=1 Tax=Solanum tuberosum TaxID=4113 RepID=A0ABQ7W9I7_SOLTU|nr:hypothetical protein KY290_008823 [Solanum tuberosum]